MIDHTHKHTHRLSGSKQFSHGQCYSSSTSSIYTVSVYLCLLLDAKIMLVDGSIPIPSTKRRQKIKMEEKNSSIDNDGMRDSTNFKFGHNSINSENKEEKLNNTHSHIDKREKKQLWTTAHTLFAHWCVNEFSVHLLLLLLYLSVTHHQKWSIVFVMF